MFTGAQYTFITYMVAREPEPFYLSCLKLFFCQFRIYAKTTFLYQIRIYVRSTCVHALIAIEIFHYMRG